MGDKNFDSYETLLRKNFTSKDLDPGHDGMRNCPNGILDDFKFPTVEGNRFCLLNDMAGSLEE
jgi:hypothetical protein